MLIALLTVLLNVVNTSGEYLFGRYVVDTANAITATGRRAAAAREQFIGTTSQQLFQLREPDRIPAADVRRLAGVQVPRRRQSAVHPPDRRAGGLPDDAAARRRSSAMRWLKVADNSLDYSLGNTTKQALWLPTSREAKYKAKQAVDSFCMRAGDVVQAGVVYAGELAGDGGARLRRGERRAHRRLAGRWRAA